jgi:hypothetical protein
MPRLLPLLLPLLLITACSGAHMDGMILRAGPAASATAVWAQDGQGGAEGSTDQNAEIFASPSVGELTGGQSTPLPTTDFQATIDIMVRQQIDVTVQARNDAILIARYTADQQVIDNARVVASETAQHPAETATKAAQDAEATQQTAYITQSAFVIYATQQAPAQALKAADANAQARTALIRALAAPASVLVLLIFAVALCVYVWRNPRPVAEVQQEAEPVDEFPELRKLNPAPRIDPYTPMVKRVIPAHVPEGVLVRFAQTVKTSHNPGGIPFSRAQWVDQGLMSRKSWTALIEYFTDPAQLYALKIGDADSSPMAFTPEGVRYLRGFEHDPPTEGKSPLSA